MRLLVLIFIFFSPTLMAYPIAKYVGVGTGYTWTQSTFREKVDDFGGEEIPSYSEVENDSLPFSLYGGFRFHTNYGLELGYVNYGSINFVKSLTKTYSTQDGNKQETRVRNADIETSGFLLSHVLYYQPISVVTLQAKFGVLFGDTRHTDAEDITTVTVNTGETDKISSVNSSTDAFAKFQMAIGALYQYDQDWLIRLQVNQVEFEHTDEKEKFAQWFTQLSFEHQL